MKTYTPQQQSQFEGRKQLTRNIQKAIKQHLKGRLIPFSKKKEKPPVQSYTEVLRNRKGYDKHLANRFNLN